MVADNFREAGTRLLTPLARNFPLDPMGISLLSLATAIGAGYCFAKATPGSQWLLIAAGLVFLTALLDALDGIVGEEYSYTLDRMNRGSGNPSAEVKPEGLGKPVQSKPKSLTLTNSDAAVTSRHLREMSQSDRVKAAASALPDLVALMKN